MHLHSIKAVNFRIFGDGKTAPKLDWTLRPTLNILVGENDAGKSAIVDAIRHVLWTTSFEATRLQEQDFHVSGVSRATELAISATLKGLDEGQESALLEWLTYEEDGTSTLYLTLHARWIAGNPPKRRARIETEVRCGADGTGPELGAAAREMVRTTYLRPLRDAENELRPGRASRLSQILAAHPDTQDQKHNDFDREKTGELPTTLVGLMAHAQHHMGKHEVIRAVEESINTHYLDKFAFAGDTLAARIRLATELALNPILERFELTLEPADGVDADARCPRGLGYNNVLFMATELVLLKGSEELALLLIEEPEAHLHPQLQDRVMALLSDTASDANSALQVVMTTHSPSLVAGAPVQAMTLVVKGRTFQLDEASTRLEPSDYAYLRRFLESTRANLFFARGVAVVEGPGEALLLPALAKACGFDLAKHGVSVVNVGDVGLYHYARILQRKDDIEVPVPVACITDFDVVPNEAKGYVPVKGTGNAGVGGNEAPEEDDEDGEANDSDAGRVDESGKKKKKPKKRFFSDYTQDDLKARRETKENRAAGGKTIVCVSEHWTLEYDLAYSGCSELMHMAIGLAVAAKKHEGFLPAENVDAVKAARKTAWEKLKSQGLAPAALASEIYKPLYKKQGSKAVAAQYAAALLESGRYGEGDALLKSLPPYLQRAIGHLMPGSAA
ncbi:ATP-dependent nuclease [Xanthomonas translucens]|uniref:ATP-dependent nuclease n=3 Tax=Xanthomonas campestris pv. translucens TaxID=343 RepID=UPI000641B2DE|nr:AAA family ATPase [Xanthomonas translucens]MCT8272523.1 AAA family ATPase [Xanthomonas translucens pv. undulosa]QEN93698.1 AAA family ATPase [Xanthomonas translucens pv. undulosa]QEO26514.1 AAA family ATPase [Xanthomonas translucens pv. undulosa]QSQ54073.1 AAA family ATPase [Xanthomonas translucens pv. undulosa]QSQ60306.1 AAA family ATPase [Xanthomonas translucens pv. undulosa]